jgi:hypothetical protein
MHRVKRFLKKHWRLVAFDSTGGLIIIFLAAFAISYFLQSSTLKQDVSALDKNIEQTHNSYKSSIEVFEKIQDLKVKKQKTDAMELLYASSVKNLSDLNFASADAQLKDLNGQIKKVNDELAAAAAAAAAKAAGLKNPPSVTSNTPPGSGFSYQMVKTDVGDFAVSLVAADLNSTRVVVDTATDGDCKDNCPVLSLGDYVARSGAFAGINGSYFCPASYPTCAGKTNSFDTLVMNKIKTRNTLTLTTMSTALFPSQYLATVTPDSSARHPAGDVTLVSME